jgi:hypothetical protein
LPHNSEIENAWATLSCGIEAGLIGHGQASELAARLLPVEEEAQRFVENILTARQ